MQVLLVETKSQIIRPARDYKNLNILVRLFFKFKARKFCKNI